jgi:Protein of unknown function (DUF3617)
MGLKTMNFPVLLCAVLLAGAGQGARAEGLQPGLWRSVQTPTIDGVTGRSGINTRCLTPADVGDLERTFSPVSRTTNSTCEQTERELTPQRLKWRLQCKGQLDMDVAGEFLFREDRYSATIVASSSMLGKPLQEVRTVIEAERVGECP